MLGFLFSVGLMERNLFCRLPSSAVKVHVDSAPLLLRHTLHRMLRFMPRSITRFKELARALPPSDLNRRMARLVVLHEDLRIEFYAAAEDEMAILDSIGDLYRRLYFIRRAILTTMEIKGALQQLDQLPEFRELQRSWSKPEIAEWREAITFLIDKNDLFKTVRDDVGGHFSQAAAAYAIDNMPGSVIGKLTIQEGSKHDTAGAMLRFADAIVLTAMTKHKGQKDARDFYTELLQLLKEALGRITRQVHILTYHYLWPRFGG
jgi:hypothetical protein